MLPPALLQYPDNPGNVTGSGAGSGSALACTAVGVCAHSLGVSVQEVRDVSSVQIREAFQLDRIDSAFAGFRLRHVRLVLAECVRDLGLCQTGCLSRCPEAREESLVRCAVNVAQGRRP